MTERQERQSSGVRRGEILDAAAEVFAARGYAHTSMREVAAAAGILPGSLYHHFPAKEAIAVELVDDYHLELARAANEFEPAGADSAAGVAALRGFADRIGQVSGSHRAALQITLSGTPSTAGSALKTAIHAEPAAVARRWRTLIASAVATRAIAPDTDPRILRHVLHRTLTHVGLPQVYPAGPDAVTACITELLLNGLVAEGRSGRPYDDRSKPARVVDEATARWAAQAAEARRERPGRVLDAARTEFARRGFEAATMRDIAETAGIKASNLYRYFASKDAMIERILGDFSDQLVAAFREVGSTGAGPAETLDALLWLLNQAGRRFTREITLVRSARRLRSSAVTEHYFAGAATRLTVLSDVVRRGVDGGGFREIAEPDLVACCLREMMWAPMRDLLPVSANRVRRFHRQSLLSGLTRGQ